MTFEFSKSAQRMIKYDRSYLMDGLIHLDTRDTVYNRIIQMKCHLMGNQVVLGQRFMLACIFTLMAAACEIVAQLCLQTSYNTSCNGRKLHQQLMVLALSSD